MYSMPIVRQYESRSTPRMSRSFISALAAEAARDELAVEVPEGEAVVLDLEVGMRALLYSSGSMSAIRWPRTRKELMSSCTRAVLATSLGEVDIDVLRPVDRVVRDAQRGEDLLVEALLADQQLVHDLQELAGAGALDDAVVVGASQRDRLADAELDERLLARALELGRVLERAGADDAALALHEPRHRVHRADAARVGERDRGAGEVGGGELVGAGPVDEVLVGARNSAKSIVSARLMLGTSRRGCRRAWACRSRCRG